MIDDLPSGYLTVRHRKWPIEIDGVPFLKPPIYGIFHGELLVITRGFMFFLPFFQYLKPNYLGFFFKVQYVGHFPKPNYLGRIPTVGFVESSNFRDAEIQRSAMKLFVKPIPGFITEGRGLRFSVDM